MTSPFDPGRLGPLSMRNRVLKCGTNEGMSRNGLMTQQLIDWHREFAAGGVGLTTLAYCAVSPEGRTFRHQLHMRDEALPGLRDFTEAIHAEGALAGIQLGHAGWFANPHATKEAPVGPSRTFSAYAQTFAKAMQPADFDRLERAFADAASKAVETGFDGIEIHLGHGYLLSQFLCPWNNRRRDEFGGSLENRARFPRRVMKAVYEAVGGRAAVWPKLNMDDGFKGGLSLDEGVQVGRWLAEDGSADSLQLTGGHTTKSPMYLMRGDVPLKQMIDNEKNWVRRWGMRIVAPSMLKAWAFEEAFFLPMARRFREAIDLPLMLLGGVNRLDTMQAALDEGFEFLAMGRALIRDPDLVRRMHSGQQKAGRCSHCNLCIIEMERGGTRCVERTEAKPATAGPSAPEATAL